MNTLTGIEAHRVDEILKHAVEQRDDNAATSLRRRQCGLKKTWSYQKVFTTLEICGAGAPNDDKNPKLPPSLSTWQKQELSSLRQERRRPGWEVRIENPFMRARKTTG